MTRWQAPEPGERTEGPGRLGVGGAWPASLDPRFARGRKLRCAVRVDRAGRGGLAKPRQPLAFPSPPSPLAPCIAARWIRQRISDSGH